MPGKPPYFPFYVNDFLADGVVALMTTEQVGAYTFLLCRAWQEEPTGTLPATDAILAKWSRLELNQWLDIKDGVLAAFRLGDDERYHQKRMEHEYGRLTVARDKKSKGGKRGAKSRWHSHGHPNDIPNGIPIGIPTLRTSESDSGSEAGSGSSSSEGGAGGNPPAGFAAFWAAYPKKMAKPKAVEAWLKLNPNHELQAKILAAVEAQRRSDSWVREGGRFVPHPTTWLNQQRWTDEIPPPSPPSPRAGTKDRMANARNMYGGQDDAIRDTPAVVQLPVVVPAGDHPRP